MSTLAAKGYVPAHRVVDLWISHAHATYGRCSKSGMVRKGRVLSYKGRVVASRITGVTLITAKYIPEEARVVAKVQDKLVERGRPYCFVPVVHGHVALLLDSKTHEPKCTISLRVRLNNLRYLRSRVYQARQSLVNRRTRFEQLPTKAYHYAWWIAAAKRYASAVGIQYGEEFEPLADYVYRHNAKLFGMVAMDDPKMEVLTC